MHFSAPAVFPPSHSAVMSQLPPPLTGPLAPRSLSPSLAVHLLSIPGLTPPPPSSLFHHTILLCWRVRQRVPIATRHFCWPLPWFAWQSCRTFSRRAKIRRGGSTVCMHTHFLCTCTRMHAFIIQSHTRPHNPKVDDRKQTVYPLNIFIFY